jgi:hypothetical protein
MATRKIRTVTHKIGYKPYRFVGEGKKSRLVEYPLKPFDTIEEVKAFLDGQSESDKGYIIMHLKQEIFLL